MKHTIKKGVHFIRSFTAILYGKALRLFGIKRDKSVIPKGCYCYEPDHERNKTADSGVYYTIFCPYYKWFTMEWKGCSYLGVMREDILLYDQCKICGENYGFD